MADLGDLGVTKPSNSSSVGRSGPSLDDLLQNSIVGESRNSRAILQQIQALQQQQGPSMLERLLSPAGALTAAGTAGIALGGGGAANAASFGLGGLGAIQGQAAGEAAAKDEQLKALADEYNKSQERLEKARTRLATVFNTNPEALLSPEGEAPDARVLGWYITGTDIPLFPQTRLANDRHDERWKNRYTVLSDALGKARTPAQAANIMRSITNHLDWPLPDGDLQSIAGAMGTPEFEKEFGNTLLRYGGASALDAMIYAGENDLPLHHPDVLGMIQFQQDPDTAGGTPSQQLNQRFINLMDEVNRWQSDPRNAEFVLQIQREHGGDEDKATAAIIDTALKGRNADIAFFKDKANIPGDRDLALLQQAYSLITSKESLLNTVRTAKGLKSDIDLPEDELTQRRGKLALNLLEEAESATGQKQGNRDAVLRNNAASSFQRELGFGLGASYQLTDIVVAAALKDAPRAADGTVMREQFEALVRQYTQDAIQQNRKKD